MKIDKHKPEIYSIAAFLVLAFIAAAIFAIYSQPESEKVRSNIYFQDQSLKGKSYSEARMTIEKSLEDFNERGLAIAHANRQTMMFPSESSIESGIVQQNFRLSPEETWDNLVEMDKRRIFARRQRKNLPVAYQLNEDNIKKDLEDSFPDLVIPAQDAAFYQKDGTIAISQEKIGQNIDSEQAIGQIEAKLASLDIAPVKLQTMTAYPNIAREDLQPLREQAADFASRNVVLAYGDSEWEIEKQDILLWMSVTGNNNSNRLDINTEKIKTYLQEKISPEIDQEPQLPRFEVSGNRINNWQLGKDGLSVDLDSTAEKIRQAIISSSSDKIAIDTKVVAAEKMDSAGGLLIKEIIGTGHSNFAGSSSNRRHNIKTGADALHGLLIKPDEEFSLIGALGEIDAASGYLPELVIKGNKTIPEYGGGLCQIGTTMFRTTLASGLPVTERRNHSYRVSYYEPAGTDATIYDPAPDYKFKNDTGNYVLIQARIEGDDIYFDFWGTSDGREATTTDPVIYNIVKPEPTKIVYTTDLEPGQKKCTESSHNGADAYFDYTVTYPATSTEAEPVVKEKRFSSHYVPWQAVCLVGTSTPEIATSTATSAIETDTASSTQ